MFISKLVLKFQLSKVAVIGCGEMAITPHRLGNKGRYAMSGSGLRCRGTQL